MTTTTAGQSQAQGNRFGGAKDMFSQNRDKAMNFAKARPAATAALAGVVGLALLNTLRGR